MIPPFIDLEQIRKREDRVAQALQLIKSIRFNWVKSPVKVLQNGLQFMGLDWTVFEEDPVLFCTIRQRLSGKFRKHLRRYRPLLDLINQRHWRWQIEMVWEVLLIDQFKKTVTR